MAEGGSFDGAPECGACHNCGLLCHHSVADIHRSQYLELTYGARFMGSIFPEERPDLIPWCYRQIPLMREITEAAGQEFPAYDEQRTAEWRAEENAAAIKVLARDRQCDLWYEYQPGDNPERHLDEYRMRELETRREQFDQMIFSENRRLQLTQDQVDDYRDYRLCHHRSWYRGIWESIGGKVASVSFAGGSHRHAGTCFTNCWYGSDSDSVSLSSVSRNRYGFSRLLKRNAISSRYASRCFAES